MTVVVIFYMVFMSPPETRAFYGAFAGIGIVTGFLIAFLLGLGITNDVESGYFRVVFGFGVIASVI